MKRQEVIARGVTLRRRLKMGTLPNLAGPMSTLPPPIIGL